MFRFDRVRFQDERDMWLRPLISLLVFCFSFQCASYTIAVVGKTKNDSFYEQSYKGCLEFAKTRTDVRCLYDGADDYQDVRTQVLVVNDLMEKNIDALMVSTTDSNFLVKGALKLAKKKNIPVLTFDSDLLQQDSSYRIAYVGTNNFDFGVALGNATKTHKKKSPQPICIQTGHRTTPNLNKRVEGVRFALSGQSKNRLDGTSGWIEYERCPLYTMGKREDALKQLVTIIDDVEPPIFIAVAGFAQFNPQYSNEIQQFKNKLSNDEITIISADTEMSQLDILKLGLSTINIGQNPFEMGRKGAEILFEYLVEGKRPVTDKLYLDFHYCDRSNADTCTINH